MKGFFVTPANEEHALTELIVWNDAIKAIEEARTIDEIKDVRDKAEALRLYSKQAGETLEVQNAIAEIKIRAERKAGDLLDEMERSTVGDNQHTAGSNTVLLPNKPTLADIGITKTQSSRWQKVASMPEKEFEEHVHETTKAGKELTTAGVLKKVKKKKQEKRQEEKQEQAQDLPHGLYNVIYADPPWQYDNTGVHGAADHHYPTMPLGEICSLLHGLQLQVAENAVLFMWVTNPFLQDAFQVIEAWNFEYKTNVAWVKTNLVKPGSGFYVRGRHELLYICTKGSFTPLDKHISPPIGSVITADVLEHSRKPEEAYHIIERLYPDCNYIELFSRNQRDGWDMWGYDVPG